MADHRTKHQKARAACIKSVANFKEVDVIEARTILSNPDAYVRKLQPSFPHSYRLVV
jgi:hypothetical protein